VCGGAWGRGASRVGEKIRQGLDLEHWAAFQRSFEDLERLTAEVGSGRLGEGEPPATIVTLSGDVHHAYLMEVGFPRGAGVKSSVFQAVCSPFRNPLNRRERLTIRLAGTRGMELAAHALAKAAGVREPGIRWRLAGGREPWFDNQVGTIELEGRRARLFVEKTIPDEEDDPSLETVINCWLAD
jgi:hypothetical protein